MPKVLAAILTALMASAAHAQPVAGPPAAALTPASPEAAALRRLFADSDEAQLKRNPIFGLFRGDLRYASEFGDYITPGYFDAERAAAEGDLRRLRAIARDRLGPRDRISYDVYEWTTLDRLEGLEPELLALSAVRPIDHMNGFHTFFPELSSGQGVAPFRTLKDYEDNLKRIDGFGVYTDRAIGRFREGMAAGVTQPRLVVDNVVGQLDTLIAQGIDGSIFLGPTKTFPEAVAAADRARLTTAYRSAVGDKVLPAFTRLRDFLKTEYRAVARETVGLGQMKGGPDLYRALARSSTTTDMTPAAIHDLGLSEVARIRGQMEAIQTKVGFKGTLRQFFDHIRTDPQFKPKSKEDLTARYQAAGARVEANLPKLFSLVPKARLDIKPTPEFREKNSAGGEYQQGTPDGSRAGVFYYNSYDLPSRTTPGIETLYLHEGKPGHHFQVMLAVEDASLPAFQRFGGNTAYVEGWALYAESLGEELGMFRDPYSKLGNLDDEMLRAMRLVVDTGLHAKGWSRERSIEYMLDNSSMGQTDAIAEVERYIAIPSQALAYKIGQLTIRRLRTEAERELGAKFDVRAFHAAVLQDGALPMAVLERKIRGWIAERKQAA